MQPRLLLFAGATLALTSCATLNESECRTANWRELGARDGSDGYPRSRLDEHRKACSEFGIGPNDANWFEGYEAGLQNYCTVDNGYKVGRNGGYYARVCPARDEAEFVDAYNLGKETHDVEQEMADLDRRVEALQQRLVSNKVDDATRREVRRQLSDLYDRGHFLRRSHDRLENEWNRRY